MTSSNRTGRTVEYGFCETHKKRAYPSRKLARRAMRTLHLGDKGVRPYACDVIAGAWHLGHLPDIVRQRGVVSASAIFDAAYRKGLTS